MQLFVISFSWKYKTGSAITFLFIQIVHEMGIPCHVLHLFYFSLHYLIRHPYIKDLGGKYSFCLINIYICACVRSLSCITEYETGAPLDWDGDLSISFYILSIWTLMLALGNERLCCHICCGVASCQS